MYNHKRKRLDTSPASINKPFRSPVIYKRSKCSPEVLVTEEQFQTVGSDDCAVSNMLSTATSSTEELPTATSSSPILPTRRPEPQNCVIPQFLSSPRRSSITGRPVIQRGSTTLHLLQRHHSSLLSTLQKASTDVDTLRHALNIVKSSTDDELVSLVSKWRVVSREAAEELFSTAKDRVNRMGGVGVWRERYMKKSTTEDETTGQTFGWDGGAVDEVNEEELTAEQREQLEIVREELAREKARYENVIVGNESGGGDTGVGAKTTKVDRDDDTFTMDMMLQQLNVDLDLIGFDVHAQRWVD